jgi:hypothetical protein
MTWANKITGPNAGGPHQFPIRTPLAARVVSSVVMWHNDALRLARHFDSE